MNSEPHTALQACNCGSGSTWPCATRTNIGRMRTARKESYWPPGALGAAPNVNARQEQTSAKETQTEIGFAQVYLRVAFVKTVIFSEKTDCEMGAHAEKGG